MAWITPKTNWVATDPVNASDYNRIANNLNFVKTKLKLIVDTIEANKQIADLPYPSVWNEVEDALEKINELTYQFDIGNTKTFAANQPYIDYAELNRIETFTNKIYLQYVVQKNSARHLAYRMGESKWRAVPRVQYAKDEPIGNRLEFRLGSMRGVKL